MNTEWAINHRNAWRILLIFGPFLQYVPFLSFLSLRGTLAINCTKLDSKTVCHIALRKYSCLWCNSGQKMDHIVNIFPSECLSPQNSSHHQLCQDSRSNLLWESLVYFSSRTYGGETIKCDLILIQDSEAVSSPRRANGKKTTLIVTQSTIFEECPRYNAEKVVSHTWYSDLDKPGERDLNYLEINKQKQTEGKVTSDLWEFSCTRFQIQ